MVTLFTIAFAQTSALRVSADPQVTLAIDADTSGNSPTSIGSIDSCAAIPIGGSFQMDVIVDSIPPVGSGTGGISGFGFDVLYDPSILTVTGKSPISTTSLIGANGSSSITSFSNSLPDTDGDYRAIEFDFSSNFESGAGTLIRLTMTAVAGGLDTLTLDDTGGGDMDGIPDVYAADTSAHTIGDVQGAMVVVGGQCPSPPIGQGVGGSVETLVSRAPSGPAHHPLLVGSVGVGLAFAITISFWFLRRHRAPHHG